VEDTLSVPAQVNIREEKTCTGYRSTYIYVLNENPGFMALGAKRMGRFCSQVFFGN